MNILFYYAIEIGYVCNNSLQKLKQITPKIAQVPMIARNLFVLGIYKHKNNHELTRY